MKNYITILFICIIFKSIIAQPTGYYYGKIITIDHTKVSGTSNLTDFPILFSVTDNDLRTVANGGHVESDEGHDIIFTTSDCSEPLNHQLEKYNPITGELVCWVKIPILSHTDDTEIQIYYGNASINSSTSSTSAWSASYDCVQHLTEDPGGTAPQMLDATTNENDATSQGSMSSTNVVSGKIGNAISFDESDDAFVIPDFDYTQSFSVSFWFNVSNNTGNDFQYIYSHGAFGVNHSLNIYFGEDNTGVVADRNMLKTIFQDANDATNTSGLNAGTTFTDGSWHYYAISVGNSGGATIYIDGAQVANVGILGGNTFNPTTDIYIGSRSDLNSARFYGSLLDELQITNTPRAAAWIATEYANQNDPSSFYTIGAETVSNVLCVALPIQLILFEGKNETKGIRLKWCTATEINNDFYTVQKSHDAISWEDIGIVDAAGNSSSQLYYEYLDADFCEDIFYYRLKQTDYDGSYKYSKVLAFHGTKKNILNNPYPNPCNEVIYLQSSGEVLICKIYDVYGKEAARYILEKAEGIDEMAIELSTLPEGVYFLELQEHFQSQKFIIVKRK